MPLFLTAVFDEKAFVFTPPMANRSKGEAIRSFTDEANRKESGINAHPEDYTLYHVGDYDECTGLLVPCNPPVSIGRALEFVDFMTEDHLK